MPRLLVVLLILLALRLSSRWNSIRVKMRWCLTRRRTLRRSPRTVQGRRAWRQPSTAPSSCYCSSFCICSCSCSSSYPYLCSPREAPEEDDEEEICHEVAPLVLSEGIKRKLEMDHAMINKRKKLVQLPAQPNIVKLLEMFVTNHAIQRLAQLEKQINR